MEITWNPWHGCHKKSEGCLHCYMFQIDEKYEKDSSSVKKTNYFQLPIKRNRKKEYTIPSGTLIYTCFTSDFLIEEADEWRKDIWNIIKERADCHFLFLTKRPERFLSVIPEDWSEGYENVIMGVSCENQKRMEERMQVLLDLPIKHKIVALAPMIEKIEIGSYLTEEIELVICDGESGKEARPIDYNWILSVREQCIRKKVSFTFRQTGANFIKDGKQYQIPKKEQHRQAKKAGINYIAEEKKV